MIHKAIATRWPVLNDEQKARVEKLTDAQLKTIDQTLLSNASSRWRTAAFMAGGAMMPDSPARFAGIPDVFYVQRVRELCDRGELEFTGDLEFIGSCEFRLPAGAAEKGHSEDYFSKYRDHWWNKDFLELMARRWNLDSYSSLLDIGCGEFHWSRLLAPFLNSPVITGVDSDPKWASNDLSKYQSLFPNAGSLKLFPGNAEKLPFADDSFDVVTGQTVLIHCAQPKKAISEMQRVVKPGGIVISAEPNNMAPHLTVDSIDRIREVSERFESAKIYLYEQYGKYLEGEGYNSIGDLVPLLFQNVGLNDVRTYLSDKCLPLIPPYESEAEADTIDSIRQWAKDDSGPFDMEITQRFVEKAEEELGPIGMDVEAFTKSDRERVKAELESETLYSPGMAIMYLVSGKKT